VEGVCRRQYVNPMDDLKDIHVESID